MKEDDLSYYDMTDEPAADRPRRYLNGWLVAYTLTGIVAVAGGWSWKTLDARQAQLQEQIDREAAAMAARYARYSNAVASLNRVCPVYAIDLECPNGWHRATADERVELRRQGWRREWSAVEHPALKAPRALCLADVRPPHADLEVEDCPAQAIDPDGAGSYAPPPSPGPRE
jgi:hypothetical protein